MFEHFIFYIFSFLLLFSASMVIAVRNPVHAALFLVLSFFSMAAIWLLLLAEFLAIVLVLVYVGAVMVLFLFVVMLLDINFAKLREGFTGYLWSGLIVAGLIALVMRVFLSMDHLLPVIVAQAPAVVAKSNTAQLGQTLFTEYLYQFEIAGAILLVAIIAAISLTSTERKKGNRTADPAKQVQVKKSDRLRVLDMKAERHEDRT